MKKALLTVVVASTVLTSSLLAGVGSAAPSTGTGSTQTGSTQSSSDRVVSDCMRALDRESARAAHMDARDTYVAAVRSSRSSTGSVTSTGTTSGKPAHVAAKKVARDLYLSSMQSARDAAMMARMDCVK